jgi:hypothetical protein
VLLRPFVRAGWVVTDGPGRLRGYHLRTSWGQGPVIARDPEAGRMLLDVKRALCGAAGSARIGIPLANEAALAYLQAPGFRCTMVETRGVRGAPVDWRPQWIWGQFNGSLG